MRYNPMTRRQFLIGAGGAMLAIPVLPSLLPKAYAQAMSPKRFFALTQDNGRYPAAWYPSAAEEMKLVPNSAVPFMREMQMRNISGDISPILNSPYFNGSMRDKLLMFRGLDGLWNNTQGHQVSSMLAGNLGSNDSGKWEVKHGPSIDYVMAKNPKSNSMAGNPKSYLNLGPKAGPDISFKYNPTTQKMEPAGREYNPRNAFASLFTGTTMPAPAGPTRSKKVVDLVLENYKRVLASTKIAKSEKDLLQSHIDSVNELEASITASQPVQQACTTPSSPTGNPAEWNSDGITIERINKQNMDIMIAAIKCGLVNVGTIQLNVSVDDTVYNNLGVTGNYHGAYTHTSMNLPEVLKITQWFASQYGYFISQLDVEEPGTGRTYLDNSLVYYGNCMGEGTAHGYYDLPVLLAGSLGGRVKTGRYIDYTNRAKKNWDNSFIGRNYCAFLVTMLQAMGLQPVDYQQNNVSEGFGSDTLHEVGGYDAWRLDRKNPLPGILA